MKGKKQNQSANTGTTSANLDHLTNMSQKRKVCHQKEEATFVFPHTLEETVRRVSSIIASEIRGGSWSMHGAMNDPDEDGSKSQNTSIIDDDTFENQSTDSSFDASNIHFIHQPLHDTLIKAARALEEFSVEMILPSLLSAGIMDNGEGPRRALIATLLSLREILMMNANAIFFLKPSSQSNSLNEEKALSAHLLATGVIYASIEKIMKIDNENGDKLLFQDVQRAIDDYDSSCYGYKANHHSELHNSKSVNFSSCLPKLDGTVHGIMPSGKKMEKQEEIAWKVSFNRAREKHPLICGGKGAYRATIPKPTACALYMVQKNCDENDDQSFLGIKDLQRKAYQEWKRRETEMEIQLKKECGVQNDFILCKEKQRMS